MVQSFTASLDNSVQLPNHERDGVDYRRAGQTKEGILTSREAYFFSEGSGTVSFFNNYNLA